ncbi:MAG: four helix bundle protein [Phycisphaerales bacterium]|nr:MAG: four helix bundle protein [Phycisphaerales bacterium]
MGRCGDELLSRIEHFADRCVAVAEELDRLGRSQRIVDQLIGSGTSVGANMFEADEGMSRKDFCRSVAISIKELNETRFWLRLIARRDWIPGARLDQLAAEVDELKRILGAILSRSRANNPRKTKSGPLAI